jgi:transcriptional regulator with XRE-family HTH domain
MIIYHNFGDFIAKKREERRITLREMARRLDVSAPYQSDVEKDRRYPFDTGRLEKIVSILNLDKQEQELMYDLAGKRRSSVSPDLPEYIMERYYVSAALRTARDMNAGEAEWMKFVEELKKRKG